VEEVFETIFYFMRHDSREIQSDALHALGSVCIRHYNLMLESKLKHLYIDILTEDFYSVQHKIKVPRLVSFLCKAQFRNNALFFRF
jgi:cohesin loading factor subunit SCC2